MKKLTNYLLQKKEVGKLFVPYIMAGANGLDNLTKEIEMLAENGATAIELGVPFSDPVADGPIIQAAGLDALANKVTLKKIVQVLQNFQSPVPLILMGYYNSFFHYGLAELITDLASTDVAGFIIPDLPFEHQNLLLPLLDDSEIALLQLVTLTSHEDRIKELVQNAEGFVYAVTINGTTGTGKNYRDDLDQHLEKIVELADIPVLAGFGVSNPQQVARFSEVCDGVVVGSKIVQSLKNDGLAKTGQLVCAFTH